MRVSLLPVPLLSMPMLPPSRPGACEAATTGLHSLVGSQLHRDRGDVSAHDGAAAKVTEKRRVDLDKGRPPTARGVDNDGLQVGILSRDRRIAESVD